MTDLRYPIGRFAHEGPVRVVDRIRWMDDVAMLPAQLRAVVARLDDRQLDTPYRPDGWTIRQVVHHLPDSHVNCYIRFKWALTESEPRIKAYDEVAWAALEHARTAPIATSLALLEHLHAKWGELLRTLTDDQWERQFIHPESGPMPLSRTLGSYAWHGRHHLAHITGAIARHGW